MPVECCFALLYRGLAILIRRLSPLQHKQQPFYRYQDVNPRCKARHKDDYQTSVALLAQTAMLHSETSKHRPRVLFVVGICWHKPVHEQFTGIWWDIIFLL